MGKGFDVMFWIFAVLSVLGSVATFLGVAWVIWKLLLFFGVI